MASILLQDINAYTLGVEDQALIAFESTAWTNHAAALTQNLFSHLQAGIEVQEAVALTNYWATGQMGFYINDPLAYIGDGFTKVKGVYLSQGSALDWFRALP